MLFTQGFFGVFPWNVITYWFFNYLETERGYDQNAVFTTMVIAVLILAAGYPVGGALGDYFFKRTPRGRALVAMVGVLTGAVLLTLTLSVPNENQGLFMVMLGFTALFIPFAACERDRHSLRYHPAGSAQLGAVFAIPGRVIRRGAGACYGRANRRPDFAKKCFPAYLRFRLDRVRGMFCSGGLAGASRYTYVAPADG